MLSVNRDGLSLKWEDSSKGMQSSMWLHSEVRCDLSCQALSLAERRHERTLSDAQSTMEVMELQSAATSDERKYKAAQIVRYSEGSFHTCSSFRSMAVHGCNEVLGYTLGSSWTP